MNNLTNLLGNGARVLNSQELKRIKGRGSYTCFCGHVGGDYEQLERSVEADSVVDAMNSMNCGGVGVTCNGN